MRFDLRWEDQCIADLEDIFGDMETADDAVHALTWRLARDPYQEGTWDLAPDSDIRLTWLRPHREFPAVAFSYRIVEEGPDQYCLMLRARRTNVPTTS